MKSRAYLFSFVFFLGCFFSGFALAESLTERVAVQAFIQAMVKDHQFDQQQLRQLFDAVQLRPIVSAQKSIPYSITPWHQYRKNFVDVEHLNEGLKFWRTHYKVLNEVEQTYGVPASIIIAILGIETFYGRAPLKYRAIDSLATLAFNYPPRAAYFTKELREFLLLTREHGLDPLAVKSSYDGGPGLPQFMPSSYRNYGVEIDGDKRVDLINSIPDSIGSIANYLKLNGWRTGGAIAVPAKVNGTKAWPFKRLKPQHSLPELIQQGIQPSIPLKTSELANMLTLDGETEPQHWLIFNNFNTITRYNTSPMYAMAVYELSQLLTERFQQET